MKKLVAVLFILGNAMISVAQETYEPLFSLSDYNFHIVGEIELNYEADTHFKSPDDPGADTRMQQRYRISCPLVLQFNRNDLLFFKAETKKFLGDEPDEALVSTPTYPDEFLEPDTWANGEAHVTTIEGDMKSSLNATFETTPFIGIRFNFLKWFDQLREKGMSNFSFQVDLFSLNTYNQFRNIKGSAKFADMQLDELNDVPLSMGCGSFFSFDCTDALIANHLEEADKAIRQEFVNKFWIDYFKNLPEIPANELIDFLINPKGNYETPFSGSFNSDSRNGSQKVTLSGKIILKGNSLKKDEVNE